MVRHAIEEALAEALKSLGEPETPFSVSVPEKGFGDYSTNAALIAAKELSLTPHEVAQALLEKLEGKLPFVEKMEIAGPGFINFHLSRSFFTETVAAAGADGWGKGDAFAGKKVLCEFTDPNPFKEFHIGHLMSNTIGESISRLIEYSGAEVKRANYQGDVGPHVAKALFGLMEMKKEDFTIGDIQKAYVFGSRRYEEDAEAKKQIDAINKAVYERNDPRVNTLYDKGRALSIESFSEIYKTLGTIFDFSYFESQTWRKGLEVVRAHPALFEESEGALVFRGENYGLHTRVFVTRQGTPTYEAKDLGLIEEKRTAYPFDISLSITGNE